MAGIGFDVAGARAEGYSDAEIVNHLASKGSVKFDFAGAQKEGYTPTEILDHLSGTSAPRGTPSASAEKPSGVFPGLLQGVSDWVAGPNKTAEVFAGVSSEGLKKSAAALSPKNYVPVTGESFFGPGGIVQDPRNYNWRQLPQAIAQAAPGLATDITAARLGARVNPYVGLAAGLGSFAARNLGNRAEEAAHNRAGDGATITDEDKLRAIGTTALESVPMALGVGRFIPGLAVSAGPAKTALGAVGNLGKTAAAEAAAAGGSNVAGQVGMSAGTSGGVNIDPKEAAFSAITGGATGGLFGAPRLARDVSNAKTYNKHVDTPEMEAAFRDFANRVQDTSPTPDLEGNIFHRGAAQRAGLEALNKAHDAVKTELDAAVGQLANPLNTDAANTINAVKKGNYPTKAEWRNLEQSLGSDPAAASVMNLTRQAYAAKVVRDSGTVRDDRLTGGVAAKIGRMVTGTGVGKATLGALAADAAGTHFIAYSPQMLAALAGAYGLGRLADTATGRASPVGRFVSRFADNSGSTRVPLPPPQATPQPPPAAPVGPTGPRIPLNPGVTGALLARALGQSPFQAPPPPAPPAGPQINALAGKITGTLNRATPAPAPQEDLAAAIAAARKQLPQPPAPTSAPEPVNPLALPRDVTGSAKNIIAGLALAQRLREQQVAQQEAAKSPLLDQLTGGEVPPPAAGKEMSRQISAARALAKLRSDPEAEASDRAAAREEKQAAKEQARAEKLAAKEQEKAAKAAEKAAAAQAKADAAAAAVPDPDRIKREVNKTGKIISDVIGLSSQPEPTQSRMQLPAAIRAALSDPLLQRLVPPPPPKPVKVTKNKKGEVKTETKPAEAPVSVAEVPAAPAAAPTSAPTFDRTTVGEGRPLGEGRVVIDVDPKALVRAHQATDPDMAKLMPNREQQVREHAAQGGVFSAPEVGSVNGDIRFGNGRHRAYLAAEAGNKSIPIAVDKDSVAAIRSVLSKYAEAPKTEAPKPAPTSTVEVAKALAKAAKPPAAPPADPYAGMDIPDFLRRTPASPEASAAPAAKPAPRKKDIPDPINQSEVNIVHAMQLEGRSNAEIARLLRQRRGFETKPETGPASEPYRPLTREEMPYAGLSHTEAANLKVQEDPAYAEYSPDRKRRVFYGIKKGREMDEAPLRELLSDPEVPPKDRGYIRDLINEIHHISSPTKAKASRDHFASLMRPATAKKVKAAYNDEHIAKRKDSESGR